ncbi:AraC family transcriptional regulator [Luteimonas sp. RD2P54]|uniref:AraC family transcriptional regulator n=1 Tax=Luteimonas endophytica TaxID=3042023 RepID=A0ABT6JAR0_9GAMM|nr:AraC family transcriptional regulator [Luteimonas endophytica]MDH5823916.1 AraC family transcriptional regulator [Luteimonas endophytica]
MPEPADNVVTARRGSEAQRAELAGRIARNVPGEGVHECAVPGLAMIRADAPSQPLPCVYHPSLCVVVQGRKQAMLGEELFVYDPLHYLLVSMSVPVTGRVIEATTDRPYLCLRIDIDPGMVADLAPQIPAPAPAAPSGDEHRPMHLARTPGPLLDALLRLVRLLDTPAEAGVMAPLALREIHYRVLLGELGPRLLALCQVDGAAYRLARAIDLLKTHYAEPLPIDRIAAAACMSASTLHQRFKAATAMTPLQFQKQLRLQEARRLMLMEGVEAAAAAHRVGYESPSQFSREYRRLFGAPPRREVRAALGEGVAAG